MANTPFNPASRRNTRILAGYLQPTETEAYLNSHGAVLEGCGGQALEDRCARARKYVSHLEPRPEPTVASIPEHPHLADLRAEPTFGEHVIAGMNVDFVTVDLERIVACQPTVDWDHVERLGPLVPQVGDAESLLRFCLPLQRDAAPPTATISLNASTSTFGIVVENPDVRICGPFQGEHPGGRSLFGFSIGSGLGQMNVVSFNGRLLLNNGYHRAVALVKAGHKQVPVILAPSPAIEATPTMRNGMFSPKVVFGPAPPRVHDFISPAAVDVPTERHRFLFSIHAEIHRVRAA